MRREAVSEEAPRPVFSGRGFAGVRGFAMQDTQGPGVGFFRGYEEAGFRFANRRSAAERAEALPDIAAADGLTRKAWFSEGAVAGSFVDLTDASPASPPTALRVLFSGEGIFVGARMEEPRPQEMRALVPADHPTGELKVEGAALAYPARCDDNVVFAIDPAHRHGAWHCFFLTHAGFARASVKDFRYNESVHPVWEDVVQPAVAWESRAVVRGDAWYAFARIPWKSLGIGGIPSPPVIGFNALRVRSVGGLRYSAWARVPEPHSMVAIDFGDLYLGAPPAFLDAADFGRPVFGTNVLKLALSSVKAPARISCRAAVRVEDGGRMLSDSTALTDVPGGGTVCVEIPYALDWQETGVQAMALDLADAATGNVFHSARYELGRSACIPASNRHDWDAPRPDPSPDDPDFVAKKRDYLLSRIPRFVRRTTAQGARSDFCIESADGKVAFNLMRPGACRKMAKFIEGLFATDLDRMAAATLMVHQKVFAMHCPPLVSMHTNMTPESAMRLNGGHCYSRALALAGVMREIHRAGARRKLDATIMFVLGHVIVCVRDGKERYLFDPSFGSFFYRRDNRGFATERELAADLSLVDRWVRGRRKDFLHPASHSPAPVGNVVWPPGAPIES